ncbi:MAG: restriction endonuclease subunit [Crocinitomicaceae bacterium]|jgi:type I restriction enzyme S subunit|nr:restriction endonuclease subunit [Crocinitomicaceae bacterium]
MKLKENKPLLRFPEFDSEWFEKSFSDLFTFKNGVNATKEQYGSGYKFINVLDIIRNDFITHDKIIGEVSISEDEFQNNIVEYGDILFQRSSETREEVGQSNVYLDSQKPATFGGFVIRGKKKDDYHPEFINYLLKTSSVRKDITSKSGGSTRYNIGQETLSTIVIHSTQIEEQIKIASFLTAIENHLNILEKKKKALEKYKKGVMKKIFDREIRFKDENGNEFPEWEEKSLFDICTKKSSNISANSLSVTSGDYKIYGANGFLQYVDFYEENDAYISIVKDGAGVGRILLCEAKSSVLGTLEILKIKENTNLPFLYYLISNINFSKYVTGSTIPHIYFKDYSTEKINIPSLPEQEKIGAFLLFLDNDLAQIQNQIEKMIFWKKGLLQNMFV